MRQGGKSGRRKGTRKEIEKGFYSRAIRPGNWLKIKCLVFLRAQNKRFFKFKMPIRRKKVDKNVPFWSIVLDFGVRKAPPDGVARGLHQFRFLTSAGAEKSLCENPFLLSFRGATGDEESRSAFVKAQGEIPRFARNDSLGLPRNPKFRGSAGRNPSPGSLLSPPSPQGRRLTSIILDGPLPWGEGVPQPAR